MDKPLKFELKRKLIHILSLLYILIYYLFQKEFGHHSALQALTAILIFFLIMEFFRIQLKKKIPLFHIFWRDSEKNKIGGHVYFILGVLFAFAVFDFRIALTALLLTTFGDLAAALVGIGIGTHYLKSFPDLNWEGILAEFIVDLIISFAILQNLGLAIIMSFVATLTESFLTKLDDNLSIPIFSGGAAQLLKAAGF